MTRTLLDNATPNLTAGYDAETVHRLRRTVPGMAHFAGSGPDGKTCRQCEHWSFSDYYAKASLSGRLLKPGPCAKWKRLMQTSVNKPVPHNTAACRFFEQADKPPPFIKGRVE